MGNCCQDGEVTIVTDEMRQKEQIELECRVKRQVESQERRQELMRKRGRNPEHRIEIGVKSGLRPEPIPIGTRSYNRNPIRMMQSVRTPEPTEYKTYKKAYNKKAYNTNTYLKTYDTNTYLKAYNTNTYLNY